MLVKLLLVCFSFKVRNYLLICRIIALVVLFSIALFELSRFVPAQNDEPYQIEYEEIQTESDTNTCDWVYLEPRTYFKRQASFMFWDVSLISLSYITMKHLSGQQFSSTIQIYSFNKRLTLRIRLGPWKTFLIMRDAYDGTFQYFKMVIEFDLQNWLVKNGLELNEISIKIQISSIN